MHKGVFLLLAVWPWIIGFGYAQQQTPKEAYWTTIADPWKITKPDTMLAGFQQYNPLAQDLPALDLGTPAGVSLPLLQPTIFHPGYRTGWSQYGPFVRSLDEVRLYQQPRPFSALFYVQGVQGEQWFSALHSRQLGRRWRIAADYSIYNVNGFFNNQRVNIDNFDVNLQYSARDQRYFWQGGYLVNDVDHQQNGGIDTAVIAPDDVFLQSRKNFVPINLDNALTNWNQKTGWMTQGYNWRRKYSYTKDDSTYTGQYTVLSLLHTVKLVREQYQFVDPQPDAAYYGSLYLRTDSTKDVSQLTGLENKVGFQLSGISGYQGDTVNYLPIVGSAFLAYDRYAWNQQGRYQYHQNLHIEAQLTDNPNVQKHWRLSVAGQYFITGYNGGDYFLHGAGQLLLGQQVNLLAGISLVRETNSLLHESYLSNGAFWINNWRKQNTQQVYLGLQLKKTGTAVSLYTTVYDNFFYFDEQAQPNQWDPAQGVVRLTLRQPIDVGHFHLRNEVNWQQVPANAVIRLPKWVMRHSLFYQGKWFDKAVTVQLGLDMRYHSAFQPYAFNAALGQFFLSNENRLATYPVLDAFINMNVQGARIFAKMEHWNHGLLFPPGYYTTYGYPAAERSFKFGVSWRFYD